MISIDGLMKMKIGGENGNNWSNLRSKGSFLSFFFRYEEGGGGEVWNGIPEI